MCGENEAESGMALGKMMMIYVFVNKEKTASRLYVPICMYVGMYSYERDEIQRSNFYKWKIFQRFLTLLLF